MSKTSINCYSCSSNNNSRMTLIYYSKTIIIIIQLLLSTRVILSIQRILKMTMVAMILLQGQYWPSNKNKKVDLVN